MIAAVGAVNPPKFDISREIVENLVMRAIGLGKLSNIAPAYTGEPLQLGGLGQLSEQEAKRILMFGAAGGFSKEQIQAASKVIYPAQDEEGRLVSAERIRSGEFEVDTSEPSRTDRFGVERKKATSTGKGPNIVCPTRPRRRDFIAFMIDNEDCPPGPGGVECVKRNAQRWEHNTASKRHQDNLFNRANCQHQCCLNSQAGHPEQCRNCSALYPDVQIPSAPGELVATKFTDGGIAFDRSAGAPTPTSITGDAAGGTATNGAASGSAGSQRTGTVDQVITRTVEQVEQAASDIAAGNFSAVPIWMYVGLGAVSLLAARGLMKR